MNTDIVIRNEGMNALVEKLGMVEAERFIMMIQKDSFNYTKWREKLFDGMTVEELSQRAREYRQAQQGCPS
jgi:hypothetical protein